MSGWDRILAELIEHGRMIVASVLAGAVRTAPLVVPWPTAASPATLLEFHQAEDWLEFLREWDIHGAVPRIVASKYQRAQRLYALSWLDYDLIKAGELVALTALELALRDRYGAHYRRPNKPQATLHTLLRHMVEVDKLTDAVVPFVKRYGGSIISNLYETDAARTARKATQSPAQTTLAGIRNRLAHGDPFDGLPWSGLLELIRDLIEFAYRDMIADTSRLA